MGWLYDKKHQNDSKFGTFELPVSKNPQCAGHRTRLWKQFEHLKYVGACRPNNLSLFDLELISEQPMQE